MLKACTDYELSSARGTSARDKNEARGNNSPIYAQPIKMGLRGTCPVFGDTETDAGRKLW